MLYHASTSMDIRKRLETYRLENKISQEDLAAKLGVAFSTVNLLLSHVIEERSALERNFLAFTSGLLIAGVLIPVKRRIESVIDMFVYRES